MPTRISVLSFLLAAAATLVPPVSAQPWEGWHGPWADGWESLRFGMTRESTAERMEGMGFRAVSARGGTLRYEKRIDGQVVELIANFQDDGQRGVGGALYRIQLNWNRMETSQSAVRRIYDRLSAELQQRYEFPIHAQDDGQGAMAGGDARALEVYRGPEMQAMLEMKAKRRDLYAIYLTLDSPQLHPRLPGS